MKISYVFVFTLLLFLNSCDKEMVDEKQPIINYFPNEIGYQWTYRVTSQNVYTVDVEIVDEGTLPNGNSAKIWEYSYKFDNRTYIDSVWVSQIDNDVRIFDKPCFECFSPMPFERFHYILPLTVGNSWFSDAKYGDTTKILNQTTVSVPDGDFKDVFRIAKNRGYVTNSWTNDTLYFKEKIGILKLSQNEFNLGPVIGNGQWELVSHNF